MDGNTDDATLRTVISRAYYSAYLATRDRRGLSRIGHRKLWIETAAIDRRLAAIGDRLRKLRNAADYGDEIPEIELQARLCIRGAQVLLSRLP